MVVELPYEERFANAFQTTLSQICNSSDNVLHTNSVAPPELHNGQFRVQLEDEYALVTSGQDTNIWNVTRAIEGTTAVTHPINTVVDHFLTAGSLQNAPISTDEIRLRGFSVVNAKDPRFGAIGDGMNDDTAAIQAALLYAGLGPGGTGLSIVYCPPGVYLISMALLISYGVRLLGANGRAATKLLASPTGVFTNGSRNAKPAMLKWDGGDAWAHGSGAAEIFFDTNNIAGLHATHFEAPGENFLFHNLRCDDTAPVLRTVNDAQLTAGSNVVTFTTSTVTEDDVAAVLTFGGSVASPAAPTLSQSGTGSTFVGGHTYTVGITYLTANGETPISATATITMTPGKNMVIASPPALSGATGWFAYVSQPDGGSVMYRQQAPGSATAIGTNLTLTAPPTATGATPYKKIDRINWATPTAYPSETTQTAITMNTPAAATLANVHVQIAQGTAPFVFDMTLGGAATGNIGTLNGINNSGPLLWLKAMGQGTWIINELSGDDNAHMLRISRCSITADPANVKVNHIKCESDYYNANWFNGHDPSILLDRCGLFSLNLGGGSFISSGYSRDVVRLDGCVQTGGLSIEMDGVEGQNWYNLPFVNIIHDTTSGEAIPVSGYFANAYPKIFWGRDVLTGGNARIPLTEKKRVSLILGTDPDWTSPGSNWVLAAGYQFMYGMVFYNFSHALNDGAAWIADMDAGTWEWNIMQMLGADSPILTVDFAVNFINAPTTHAMQANVSGDPAYVVSQPNTPVGTYKTQVAYVRIDGAETTPDPIVTGNIAANQQLQVNAPAHVDNAIGYNVYCSQAGGSTLTKQNANPVGLFDVYKIFVPTTTGPNPPTVNGTISWSSPVGTIDQYNATVSENRAKLSSVVIPRHTGPVLIRFRATGKNASSTDYYARISGIEARKIG